MIQDTQLFSHFVSRAVCECEKFEALFRNHTTI